MWTSEIQTIRSPQQKQKVKCKIYHLEISQQTRSIKGRFDINPQINGAFLVIVAEVLLDSSSRQQK